MRLRKTCLAALVALLLVAVFLVPSMPASAHHSGDPAVYPLYAGKDCQVGVVKVWNDETSIHVRYEITVPGWVLTETHLAVAGKLCDIPQTSKGNPIPGLFPLGNCYKVADMVTSDDFAIGLGGWKNGDNLYVAAHASVAHVSKGCVVALSDAGQVCWWSGAMKSNINKAGYVVPGWCPWLPAVDAWEPYNNVDPSYWDQNLNPAPCAAELAKSDWIWKSFQVSNAESYTGDIVFFLDTLCLPCSAFNIKAGLCITTDNAYYFYVNDDWSGTPEGMAGFMGSTPTNFYYVADKVNDLGGGTDSRPYETVNKVYPKDATISTAQSDWSSIEFYDLSTDIKPGLNCLQIVAINEHAPPQTSDQNPAGLIYKLQACYCYVDKCESAWASSGSVGQLPFPGKNWATYFNYQVQGWELVETLTIDSRDTDGVDSSILTSGGLYKFVASGTWTNRYLSPPGTTTANMQIIDAKYCSYDGTTWTDGPDNNYDYSGLGLDYSLLDLYVGGAQANWGAYNSGHVYSVQQIGGGTAVNFAIFDGGAAHPDWYTDNDGSLTVNIYVWG